MPKLTDIRLTLTEPAYMALRFALNTGVAMAARRKDNLEVEILTELLQAVQKSRENQRAMRRI